MNKVQRLTENIERDFALYLRRSGYKGTYLAIHLASILQNWVAQPYWRKEFKIDNLFLHEWVEIEETIVRKYRTKWQVKAKNTRLAKQKRQSLAIAKARQLTLKL